LIIQFKQIKSWFINPIFEIFKIIVNMKKFIISTTVIVFLFFAPTLFDINNAYGQPEPPDHGQGTNQPPPGGGAPIGEGIVMLLAMGAVYGYRKVTGKK
jgi:hypothetical protein